MEQLISHPWYKGEVDSNDKVMEILEQISKQVQEAKEAESN